MVDNEEISPFKIIGVIGYDDDETKNECLQNGMDEICNLTSSFNLCLVFKPVTLDSIQSILGRYY